MKHRSPTPEIVNRFWDRVQRGEADECWVWQGSMNNWGYGRFHFGGAPSYYEMAHRFAYEQTIGPIPDGLVIDHLCRNRSCVNPSHMEPVTAGENVRRGLKGRLVTHCAQGHEYTAETTEYWLGRRKCRICRRERDRQYWHRDHLALSGAAK